jgi:quercetin dioxygenase-like cupin family protein
MQLYDWAVINEEQLNPLISRRVIHTERMTVCKIRLKKGAVVPMHSHENEQITVLESGKLRFIFENGEKIVSAGETLAIPPHAPHRVEALEDSLAMDLFSPVREDWRRGDDAYLRQSEVTRRFAT